MILSANPLSTLLLLPWAALWLAGGIALAAAIFRLRPHEYLILGITVGWLVQNWLANLLSMVLPVPAGFWLSAGLVFLAGLLVTLRTGWQVFRQVQQSLPQLIVFALITVLFFSAARGLAIFDDFQHLPAASLIAAGDFPPHFPLDPNVRFGYHHFLLLFAAQLIRIGSLSPWTAVDAARALPFGLAVMLAAFFARRLTRSTTGGLLGGVMMALGSGARWLLLLIPTALVEWLGFGVQLIGSGIGTAPTLSEALVNTWAVEGAGPIGFPFAFANGIFPPGVIQAHTANGLTGFALIFVLLLTYNRWQSPHGETRALGAVLSAILISIWGLLGEAELPTIAAGWALVALAWAVTNQSLRLPRVLLAWLGISAAGCVIGLLEGGAWTDLLARTAARLTGQAVEASYQSIGFQVGFPAVVSSHLGILSLFNPASLFVALLEIGPVLLVFPLLVAWGIKALRLRRWFEAALAASALFSLLMLFVQITGSTGVRNTPRLYVFVPLLSAFAVPLAWMWAERRAASVKRLVAILAAITVTGGIVMAGLSLIAAQRPVPSSFITWLDVRLAREYWNRLEPGAQVFDAIPYRAPALFGRPTDSSYTWYELKPEWKALFKYPDPVQIRAAGFRYMYLDNWYWEEIPQKLHPALSGGCVKVIGETDDRLSNFRRLLDLEGCR